MTFYLLLLISYLLGSIPFGLFVSWLFKLPDPRSIGSQNIGATNVLRSGYKGAAFLTFFFDASKGSIAVAMGLMIEPDAAPWLGLAAICGHIWPIWLKFKGGKGVATAFGVLFVLSWPICIACLMTWIAIALTTRYSSLASIISMSLVPLYSLILKRTDLTIMCLTIAFIILVAHRQNMGRLITGKEKKIGENNPPHSSIDG